MSSGQAFGRSGDSDFIELSTVTEGWWSQCRLRLLYALGRSRALAGRRPHYSVLSSMLASEAKTVSFPVTLL
jgi:hypothetical protein